MADNTVPVFTVQSDWKVAIHNKADCWVACKFRDQPSINGKIRSSGPLMNDSYFLTATDGFIVKYIYRMLKVQLTVNGTEHVSYFIAPVVTYTNLHDKSVVSLHATSGELCVSVDVKNVLQVWCTSNGMLRRSLQGHVGNVYRCRFFPSGLVILSCGADMQIKIWSAETGECPVTLIGHKAAVTDVGIVDRGRNIISVSKDGSAKLWDCGMASCLATLITVDTVINCCAINVANSFLHLGEASADTNEREIGTENKVVLLGCENGLLCGIAVKNRHKLFDMVLTSPINCIAFLTDEHFLVGCQDGQVTLFLLRNSPQKIKSWFESNSAVLCVLPFKEKGFFVGRADGSCTYQQVYADWDDSGRIRLNLTGPDCDPVYDISFDGNYIYTACRDSVIRKYDILLAMASVSSEVGLTYESRNQ